MRMIMYFGMLPKRNTQANAGSKHPAIVVMFISLARFLNRLQCAEVAVVER